MLISAQGHDALDHLQEKITGALRSAGLNDVIVVRSTTPDRRVSSDEEVHLLGLEYLQNLLQSSLIGSAPPVLRQRVEALYQAAVRSTDNRFVSRDERSGLHAISSLLLDGANIVFSTTNSPDVERLVEAREQFDWVLIEEAAKATGPELVGPLMLSGRRLLIGDHNQLAPFGAATIAAVLNDHSRVREAIGLAEQWIGSLFKDNELEELVKLSSDDQILRDVSGLALRLLELFQSVVTADQRRRLENSSHRPVAATLTEQRRMDPAIARIISHAFYDDGRRIFRPAIKCGQQSLEVFCAGIFLSFAAHVVLVEISGAIWMQIVVSIVGILMMTALAYYRSWSKKADKAPAKIKPIVAAAG
jgi:hypothetical protein